MFVEVIATCVDDIHRAAAGGADRIELVTGLLEGGMTPSLGLMEEAVAASSVPVQVMIRPHSRSFVYDPDDLRVMVKDILMARRTGAAGVVFGALTTNGRVDREALARLLDAAEGLSVTFHRAFDETRNLDESADVLAGFPAVHRVLTSGGKPSAADAADTIRRLVKRFQGTSLRILAGSGLTADNLNAFVRRTGVNEVHFGRGVRENGQIGGRIDPELIRRLKRGTGTDALRTDS